MAKVHSTTQKQPMAQVQSFEEKMRQFHSKNASKNTGQSQMLPPTKTGTATQGNKLNTSFSNLNNQMANKWANMNKNKAGGLTGRP